MTDQAPLGRAYLGLLGDVLNAPDDLIALLRVLSQFRPVWDLYATIAEDRQLAAVNRISRRIEEILEDRETLVRKYPMAKICPIGSPESRHVRKGDTRLTLAGCYGPNPWYAVFWHECSTAHYEPQYRSLLASILPAFVELEIKKDPRGRPSQIAEALGLALRQFTLSPEPHELIVLSNLSLQPLAPQLLRDLIRSELAKQGRDRAESIGHRFNVILKVLNWFVDGGWPSRSPFRKTSWSGHKKAAEHGATGKVDADTVETKDLAGASGVLEVTHFRTGDEDDPAAQVEGDDHDPTSDAAQKATRVKISVGKASQFQRQDRHRVASINARFAAQAIEMEAQQLPVTRTTLTGWDIRCLLDVIADLEHPSWCAIPEQSKAEVAAWLASSFFIGRSESALLELRSGDHKLDTTHLMLNSGRKVLWMPSVSPRHKAPAEDAAPLAITPDFGFEVEAPFRFIDALRRVSTYRNRYFRAKPTDPAGLLLNQLNRQYGTHLTPLRIEHYLGQTLRQLGPNDAVYESYFFGAPPNQHNPAVYSSVPTRRLADLYAQAVQRAEILAGFPACGSTPDLPTLHVDGEKSIGSRHVPRQSTVRDALAAQYNKLEDLRRTTARFEDVHNAYTAYIVFAFLAISGIRPIKSPIARRFELDLKTSLLFVSEKDSAQYSNARLVWLHPLAIEMLQAYLRHEKRTRQYLALKNPAAVLQLDARDELRLLSSQARPNRTADLEALRGGSGHFYFLSRHGAIPQDISRSGLKEHFDPNWLLAFGSLRHFVRTQLLLRCCSGELINPQVGHADRGQMPWGNFSSLPPYAWRSNLEWHLGSIADEIGLKLISSPWFGDHE